MTCITDFREVLTGRLVHDDGTSANRDEAVFGDPQAFDIQRHPNPHLSYFGSYFGMGGFRAVLEHIGRAAGLHFPPRAGSSIVK